MNLETVRYYERIGLMPEPARSSGGHRSYDPEHLNRLLFIRRTRDLGFGTGVIRDLIALSQPRQAVCREVKEIAEKQLSLVEERIRTLSELEMRLRAAVTACGTSGDGDCPIITDLGS